MARVFQPEYTSPWSQTCCMSPLPFFFFLKLLFLYLAAWTLSCGSQDLQLWHADSPLKLVGSSSLVRDQTRGPLLGSSESCSLGNQGSPSPLPFFLPGGGLTGFRSPLHH